jgi:hypothetical protein
VRDWSVCLLLVAPVLVCENFNCCDDDSCVLWKIAAIFLYCTSVGTLHDILLPVKRMCNGNTFHIQIKVCLVAVSMVEMLKFYLANLCYACINIMSLCLMHLR